MKGIEKTTSKRNGNPSYIQVVMVRGSRPKDPCGFWRTGHNFSAIPWGKVFPCKSKKVISNLFKINTAHSLASFKQIKYGFVSSCHKTPLPNYRCLTPNFFYRCLAPRFPRSLDGPISHDQSIKSLLQKAKLRNMKNIATFVNNRD
jgi:hypothetical protein